MITIRQIAKIAHATNVAFCRVLGDESQVAWEDAPEAIRTSTIERVKALIGATLVEEVFSDRNPSREDFVKQSIFVGLVKTLEMLVDPAAIEGIVQQRAKAAMGVVEGVVDAPATAVLVPGNDEADFPCTDPIEGTDTLYSHEGVESEGMDISIDADADADPNQT